MKKAPEKTKKESWVPCSSEPHTLLESRITIYVFCLGRLRIRKTKTSGALKLRPDQQNEHVSLFFCDGLHFELKVLHKVEPGLTPKCVLSVLCYQSSPVQTPMNSWYAFCVLTTHPCTASNHVGCNTFCVDNVSAAQKPPVKGDSPCTGAHGDGFRGLAESEGSRLNLGEHTLWLQPSSLTPFSLASSPHHTPFWKALLMSSYPRNFSWVWSNGK